VTIQKPEPAELAVLVARQLEDAGVPYAIGGAIAYGYWGNPRGTRDLDVNIFVSADRAGPALDTLLRMGIRLDPERVLATAQERGDARVFYEDVPIDLFFISIPLHESAAERTVPVTLLGQTIRVLSAEDLAVLKLLFFRGKDVVDIERIVAIQGVKLDRDYVRRWLVDCVGADAERVRKWDEICAALPAP
jgi:predicted nucleotidyltransferase